MKKVLSVLLAGVMVTSLFGCSSNEPKEQVKLTIAAAASLENAFEDELIPMFEKEYPNVTIEGVYDSSGKLQFQIEKGLDADVFFSAATIEVASSGNEVPPATRVRPITDSLTPNERAMFMAPSTKS